MGEITTDGLPAHVELVCNAQVLPNQVHDVVKPVQLVLWHPIDAQLFGKQINRT
jgi:hypothetical protein